MLPIKTIKTMARQINAMDRETRAERLARAFEVMDYAPDGAHGMMLPGGELTMIARHEAIHAFMNGLWLSTILTCFSALEYALVGQLQMHADEDAGGLPPDRLLLMARRHGLDDETLTRAFEIGGYYRHAAQKRLVTMRRSMAEEADTFDLLERDAREIMQIMGSYFYQHFAVG